MIDEFLHENTWIKLEQEGEIPCGRTGHSACSYKKEYMYIFGGYSDDNALNDMYRYHIFSKKWERIDYQNSFTELPSARASAQLCAYSEINKLYLFGGTGLDVVDHARNDIYEFDIGERKWSIIQTGNLVPSERFGHSMTLQSNYLILFGGAKIVKQGQGKLQSEYLNDLWMFSLLDKNWRRMNPSGVAPSARYRQEMIMHQNILYLIGGGTTNERFTTIFRYDIAQNAWNQISLANQTTNKKDLIFKGRMGHICILDNDQILLYGGIDDVVNTEPLCYSIDKRIWKKQNIKGKPPKAREFFSGCKFNHSMIIFGGRVGEKKTNDMYIWNISCPTPSRKNCTLRQEMVQLVHLEENQGDIEIRCSDYKIVKAHSYILKHRSYKFYESLQKTNYILELNSKMLNHILHFIYGGEINFSQITTELITDLIQFSLSSDMKYFFRILVLHCLLTSLNQNEIDILDGILRSLENKCEEAQKPFMKSLEQWMELRRSKLKINQLQTQLRYHLQLDIKQASGSSTPSNRNSNQNTNTELFKQLHNFQVSFDSLWRMNTQLYYQDMNSLRLDAGSSNFTLIALNKQFKVHKAILSARCAYFENCFATETMLQQNNELILEPSLIHNNPNLLDFLLSFLYNGLEGISKIKMNSDNLVKCLDLANYFMVKNPTFNYLIENAIFNEGITTENCLKTLQFSEQYHAIFLKNKVLTFMVQNMTQILRQFQNELLAMNPQFLVYMLKLQNESLTSSQQ